MHVAYPIPTKLFLCGSWLIEYSIISETFSQGNSLMSEVVKFFLQLNSKTVKTILFSLSITVTKIHARTIATNIYAILTNHVFSLTILFTDSLSHPNFLFLCIQPLEKPGFLCKPLSPHYINASSLLLEFPLIKYNYFAVESIDLIKRATQHTTNHKTHFSSQSHQQHHSSSSIEIGAETALQKGNEPK